MATYTVSGIDVKILERASAAATGTQQLRQIFSDDIEVDEYQVYQIDLAHPTVDQAFPVTDVGGDPQIIVMSTVEPVSIRFNGLANTQVTLDEFFCAKMSGITSIYVTTTANTTFYLLVAA